MAQRDYGGLYRRMPMTPLAMPRPACPYVSCGALVRPADLWHPHQTDPNPHQIPIKSPSKGGRAGAPRRPPTQIV
jgi:hypothetical protein